jgi:hypothetical protein
VWSCPFIYYFSSEILNCCHVSRVLYIRSTYTNSSLPILPPYFILCQILKQEAQSICGSPGFHFVFPCLTISLHVSVGRHCLIHYIYVRPFPLDLLLVFLPLLVWLPREVVAVDGAQLTWSGRGSVGPMIDGSAARGLDDGSVVASSTG